MTWTEPEDGYDKDLQLKSSCADWSASLVTFHVRALDTSGNEVSGLGRGRELDVAAVCGES